MYVDNIILVGNSFSETRFVKTTLHQHFRIKDFGKLKYFLGLEVAHVNTEISLCQRQYYLDLLIVARLTGCEQASTPLDDKTRLFLDDGPSYSYVARYRRLIAREVILS